MSGRHRGFSLPYFFSVRWYDCNLDLAIWPMRAYSILCMPPQKVNMKSPKKNVQSTKRVFGPDGSRFFESYDEWVATAKFRRYHLISVSNGVTAQDNQNTRQGFWGTTVDKGWLSK